MNYLKSELGPETFSKLEALIPARGASSRNFESSADSSRGGLLEMVTGLASKLLGGKVQDLAKLMESFTKIGFKPEQIEAFLPKVLALIKDHLPPELAPTGALQDPDALQGHGIRGRLIPGREAQI